MRAVLALDEPYRSTLLLRFFDDLPPRDVAKRTGVPVETARARIRRGLEQLRARLDKAHGSDGNAWRLALIPLMAGKHVAAAGAGAGTGAAAGHQLTTGAMIMAGTGTTVAVGGVALAFGGLVAWWIGARASEQAAVEHEQAVQAEKKQVETLRSDVSSRDEQVKRLTTQVATLEASLRATQRESGELKKQLDDATAALDAARTAAPKVALAAAPARKGPQFAFSEYESFNDIDWTVVAKSLGNMPAIASQLLEAMERKDQKAAMGLIGKLQKENGPLLPIAQALHEKVPGTGYNGPFTNPAFMVNAIAATLESSGKPLTADQATAAEAIGRKYAAEDAGRAAGYTESTFQVQKEIDEADVRRRFFDAIREVMTEDQKTTLWPAASRDHGALDVFSDGVFLYTVAAAIPYKERADLVTKVGGALYPAIDMPEESREAANKVIGAWFDSLPPAVLDAQFSRASSLGGTPNPVLREGMKQTLVLLQRLISDLKLEGAAADAVRRCALGVVPLKMGAP